MLSVKGNYWQGSGGVLAIQARSASTADFDRLGVTGTATLGGLLQVTLLNTYQPLSSDQLPILSCATRGGTFGALQLPAGCSINYSNTGAFLTGLTPTAVHLVSPRVSGGNFGFTFQTVAGQSYTGWRNDDLKAGAWTPFTNVLGDGSLWQIWAPLGGASQAWFRVRAP